MPDIFMCDNKECPKRHKCYRYVAIPNKYEQAYRSPEALNCEHFLSVESGMTTQVPDESN